MRRVAARANINARTDQYHQRDCANPLMPDRSIPIAWHSCGVFFAVYWKQVENVAERAANSVQAAAPGSIRLSVAPMMDWTDTYCRVFHRLTAPNARLYNEMVHAHSVIQGDRATLLALDPARPRVERQLGGHDPAVLHQAGRRRRG